MVRLALDDRRTPLLCTDQLPPNLRGLVWLQTQAHLVSEVTSSKGSHSLQPLLGLSRLQKLHLQMPGTISAAAALAQLRALSSLQELGLSCGGQRGSGFDSSAAMSWGMLSLKSLEVSMEEVSAAFVQQLTMYNHVSGPDQPLFYS